MDVGGGGVCGPCWSALPDDEPRCPRCAIPSAGVCRPCEQEPPPFSRTACLGDYAGPLARIVAALKFRGLDIAAGPASERLVGASRDLLAGCDAVTPAPSTRRRNRERGYDHARLLAAEVARRARLPLADALERRGDAPPQLALSAAARQLNVAHAFRGVPDRARGKRILLVDDVMTTGATARAAAAALLGAGAAEVRLLVLARTPDA